MIKQHTFKSFKEDTGRIFLFNRLMEGIFIFIIFIALYVILSLATYSAKDPSFVHVNTHSKIILNAGGQIGAYLAGALFWLCGYFAYAVPIAVAYLIGFILHESKLSHFSRSAFLLRFAGFLLLMLGFATFLGLKGEWLGPDGKPGAGGMMGAMLADWLSYAFNYQGALLLSLAAMLVGITWLTNFSWIRLIEKIGAFTLILLNKIYTKILQIYPIVMRVVRSFIWPYLMKMTNFYKDRKIDNIKPLKPSLGINKNLDVKPKPVEIKQNVSPFMSIVDNNVTSAEVLPVKPVKITEKSSLKTLKPMILPSLELLDKTDVKQIKSGGFSAEALEQYSREVEQHLLDFGIHVDVVAVHPGPVITRFEMQLAAGVKVSRLSALVKDLARALSVTSVRIVEVIPGKTVVGLELPNQHREIVRLFHVLNADVFQQAHSPLTLALGVDIAGYPMVVDLAKMPHLLVAGTTGSGKSVGINAMILSLLYRATPKDVRLIMIDPKMLELSIYDGIPHLLTPVVTDMKEAANALRWCVAEMERRYRLLASVGVRNLAGFNAKVIEAQNSNQPLLDPLEPILPDGEKKFLTTLPYIVVIIDELADMMMVVGKKVEQLIARIAQKARAAGIHLILATQRPSVDVLTGLIKSNIPTRVSFQVSSKIDSRTILDQQGAEQLLGHGDMLFLAPGTGSPLRVHGVFVSDSEVHRIADDWRSRGEPDYIEDVTQTYSEDNATENASNEEEDPLYDEVVAFIIETRKGSISAVQRRFKIGYNRAARLIETMESAGILGPLEGGVRDILVSQGETE